ncbi:MAG: hypothetical protein ABSG17_06350 [Spirochaetia bacterium]|jgi:hypothetical protein
MKGESKRRSKRSSREEPELSQEEKNMIMDSAIASFERKKLNRKRQGNPLLADFFRKNKVLIQYIYDVYGFPKGVVVSTAKDKVGWSLVSNRDVHVQRLDPMKLPVIQKLIRAKASIEEITTSEAYLHALRQHCAIPIPIFDPNIALFLALGRSLLSTVSESEREGGALSVQPKPPNDKELKAAISRMVARSRKYFK